MAANLEDKILAALKGRRGITRKKMFGGICYMHQGNMLCGVDKDDQLMVRVGPDQYDKALSMKHCREMDFTGRPLKGIVYIEAPGSKTAASVKKWVDMALVFTSSLPKK